MSIKTNPSIVTDGLVFSVDTSSTRSYTGPAIRNIATSITHAFVNQTNSTFKIANGTEIVDIPTLGRVTSKYVDIYNDYAGGSADCCPSPINYGTDLATNASTLHTYAIVYKSVNEYTNTNYMYRYEYNGPTYVTEAGVFSDANRIHLGDGWYWAWGTFTTNAATTKFGSTSLFMYQYLKYNRIFVAKVLLCQGDYTALHPSRWPELGTTKSSTQSIIDVARNNTVTINNLTYANTGNFSFDGTDDYISVPVATGKTRTVCMTYKLNNPGAGWGPLWRSDDWKERVFPGTITIINSNGTYYNLDGPNSTTNIVHIAYSYNETNAKSYLNGVRQSNITMDGPMNIGTYTYNFGRQAGGSTTAFVDMELYNVQFYDIQLTDEQVQQNFNAVRGRFGI